MHGLLCQFNFLVHSNGNKPFCLKCRDLPSLGAGSLWGPLRHSRIAPKDSLLAGYDLPPLTLNGRWPILMLLF